MARALRFDLRARAGFKTIARRTPARPIMRHDLKATARCLPKGGRRPANTTRGPVHALTTADGTEAHLVAVTGPDAPWTLLERCDAIIFGAPTDPGWNWSSGIASPLLGTAGRSSGATFPNCRVA